jgi:hypothetical protein
MLSVLIRAKKTKKPPMKKDGFKLRGGDPGIIPGRPSAWMCHLCCILKRYSGTGTMLSVLIRVIRG